MKLKKGSIEAKRFMAKIRAKKKSTKKAPVKKAKVKKAPAKKLGYSKDRLAIVKETSRILKKYKKSPDYHKKTALTQAQVDASFVLQNRNPSHYGLSGSVKHKDTKSHNVRISVMSGLNNSIVKNALSEITNLMSKINIYKRDIDVTKKIYPTLTPQLKKTAKINIKHFNSVIKQHKATITELKKIIK
jgi:hypothetical protein